MTVEMGWNLWDQMSKDRTKNGSFYMESESYECQRLEKCEGSGPQIKRLYGQKRKRRRRFSNSRQ